MQYKAMRQTSPNHDTQRHATKYDSAPILAQQNAFQSLDLSLLPDTLGYRLGCYGRWWHSWTGLARARWLGGSFADGLWLRMYRIKQIEKRNAYVTRSLRLYVYRAAACACS